MDKNFKAGQKWLSRCGDTVLIVGVGVNGSPEYPVEGVEMHNPDEYTAHGCYIDDGLPRDSDLVECIEPVRGDGTTRVYIAGPIGDRLDKNRPAFDAAAAEYRNRGCFVINPLDIVPDGTEYGECMRIDITAMLTCDMIVLLPDWEFSKGAKAEHFVALLCGLTVAHWG